MLDIGAGKGQDLNRYYKKMCRTYVAVDPVMDSLHELQRRVLYQKNVTKSVNLVTICSKGDDFDKIFSGVYT